MVRMTLTSVPAVTSAATISCACSRVRYSQGSTPTGRSTSHRTPRRTRATCTTSPMTGTHGTHRRDGAAIAAAS